MMMMMIIRENTSEGSISPGSNLSSQDSTALQLSVF